jgi:diguanylate cyclase (GGDEF)-like protein
LQSWRWIVIVTSGISVGMLYSTALDEERNRLQETAQSQARLLEAVARFDQLYSNDYPSGAGEASIDQIREAHANYQGFGATGEFTLARLENNNIVFLLNHRHNNLASPLPTSKSSTLAEPMRAALRGESGVMVGRDYRGVRVLAAYEPVQVLNLGIVAKIDLSEIQHPFIKTVGLAFLIGLVVIAAGAVSFFKITEPIIQQICMSEKRYRSLFKSMTNGVAVYKAVDNGNDFIFTDLNKSAKNMNNTKWLGEIGQRVTQTFPNVDEFGLLDVFRRVYRDGCQENHPITKYQDNQLVSWFENFVYRLPNGEIVAIHNDITKQKLLEESLKQQAEMDPLTGLPNRVLFQDRLTQAIEMASRNGNKVGLLFIDLDAFKLVNDTMGHDQGDILLREISDRIISCVRRTDTVARFGGDEFVSIIPDMKNDAYIKLVARKILDKTSMPVKLNGQEVNISASIGITIFPDDAESFDDLLKNADCAMYQAKASGRNRYKYYTHTMQADAVRRVAMEAALRKSLKKRQFEVFYQPQIGVPSGEVVGVEALARWHHPDMGMLVAGQFIPLAEETGLIIPLGDFVLETVCRDGRQWLESGTPLRISINLSAWQFHHDENLVKKIKESLEKTKFPPELLELEITETMMMTNPDKVTIMLSALRDMGIQISVDDFGTGYSSLSSLKNYPLNSLKMDRSFVTDIGKVPKDYALACAILSISKNLELSLVAEGAETDTQVKKLVENAFPIIQGHFFSPALPKQVVTMLLKEEKQYSPMAYRLAQAA